MTTKRTLPQVQRFTVQLYICCKCSGALFKNTVIRGFMVILESQNNVSAFSVSHLRVEPREEKVFSDMKLN